MQPVLSAVSARMHHASLASVLRQCPCVVSPPHQFGRWTHARDVCVRTRKRLAIGCTAVLCVGATQTIGEALPAPRTRCQLPGPTAQRQTTLTQSRIGLSHRKTCQYDFRVTSCGAPGVCGAQWRLAPVRAPRGAAVTASAKPPCSLLPPPSPRPPDAVL